MSLLRAVATVSGFTMMSRITGFARDILIASILGAGPIADAFFIAFKFPNFFRRLTAEGAFTVAFVPTFSRLLQDKGRKDALEFAEEVISIMGIGLFLFSFFTLNPVLSKENKKETYEQLDLFGQVFDLIKSKYVEEVKSKELIEAAINGMLSSLDPHSGFLAPKSYDDMQVDTKGSFGGLGIEVTQQDGFVKVVSPMDDTPAFKAGVLAGDFITFVDDKPMLGLTLSEAVDIMRGPVGSSVKLTIVREGLEDPIEVLVTRAVIKLTAAKVRTENDIIIMRVTTFNEQTIPNLDEGIKKAVEKLGEAEPRGFVLDLRNNPGGLLSVAISVTDLFLDQGEIVSTRDREGKGERYKASKGDIAEGKPLVILINAGSASASEIVAGALQDHRRAIVLGTKSFGKGSVQSVLPMGQSGGIRLLSLIHI